jgi:hypothetical protein
MNTTELDNLIVEGKLYVNPQLDATSSSATCEVLVDSKRIYGKIGRPEGKVHQEIEGEEIAHEAVVWKAPKNHGPFLIVGFDTEYVQATENRNRVLSYQYWAILPHENGSIKAEWGGIGYVKAGERVTRSTFFGWIYQEGLKRVDKLPRYAVLVGHYTKADVTAFFDFDQMKGGLMAIRNSFISSDYERDFNRIELPTDNVRKKRNHDHVIYAPLRDTWLLCPSLERSLESVGNLLDPKKYAKIQLPEQYSKSRMDKLLAADRKLFEAYAVRDAEICAHYALRVALLHVKEGLPANIAPTLTGIGVKLLVDFLTKNQPDNYFEECFGLEVKEDSKFVKGDGVTKKSRGCTTKKTTENKFRLWHSVFASECYHGGRNEQYFFGPAVEGVWCDYDLSGAYPTAMSMIGKPRWELMEERQEPDYWKQVKATDLAYFYIKFKFPKEVRFPIFTVRTQHGLLFPRTGEAYCCAPEIVAARNVGCQIEVIRAVELPVEPEKVFLRDFQQRCISKRLEAEKNSSSLEAAFWKEISNSSYGKLAQGLKEKQVFNIKEQGSQRMPPCTVTNPFFAAFTTSFVRATLGEVMNALPSKVIVSNCTTDGFLCTATEPQIRNAVKGPLFQAYLNHRARVLGKEVVSIEECLKVKHRIKQPLGWRTRGQATLKAEEAEPIVLAKAGIRTPRKLESDDDQNDWIVYSFINRSPDSKFLVDYAPSIRDIILNGDKDWMIQENKNEKRLAMEFDWKRQPISSSAVERPIRSESHLYFETKPWENVVFFSSWRRKWNEYNKQEVKCLKRIEALRNFEMYAYRDTSVVKRMPRNDTEKQLIRKEFAAAFAQGLWGLDKVDRKFRRKEFADWMTKHGVEMKFHHVENGKKHEVADNIFMRSEFLESLIRLLKVEVTPHFDDSKIWRKDIPEDVRYD